jgi:hypothetical protein
VQANLITRPRNNKCLYTIADLGPPPHTGHVMAQRTHPRLGDRGEDALRRGDDRALHAPREEPIIRMRSILWKPWSDDDFQSTQALLHQSPGKVT